LALRVGTILTGMFKVPLRGALGARQAQTTSKTFAPSQRLFGISKHTFQSMVRDGEKKMNSRSGFLLEGDVAHIERHLGTVLGGL